MNTDTSLTVETPTSKIIIKVIPKTKPLHIYKIVNPSIPDKCYVGSTCQTLNERFGKHKYKAKKSPDMKLYKNCGGIENCSIELLQTLEIPLYKFDLERRKQEQAWIDQLKPEWNNNYAYTTRYEADRRYSQSAKGKASIREAKRRYRARKKSLRQMADD